MIIMTAKKETINATKEVKEVKKTEVKELKEIEKVAPLKATPKKSEKISKNDVKSNATQEIKKTRNESMKVPKETTKEVPKETTQVTKEKSFEKRPSAGKQIRTLFETIISKLKDEQLEILTSQEKTKEVLKIRYAFLKEVKNEKDERKVNGHARYNKTIVKINDKDYYICNDLYERNIETFKKWCESLK